MAALKVSENDALEDRSLPLPQSDRVNEAELVFGRTVIPTPMHKKGLKKDMIGSEYAQHSYIGDAIELTLEGGRKVVAFDHKFTLANGLSVTYGQINALAGDFYGTRQPISDGATMQEQKERFLAAYSTLANAGPRLPKEAYDILAVLQAEIDAVNDALERVEDPSVVYSMLPDVSPELQRLTIGRPQEVPTYLELATINWDHFGADAWRAYDAGHALALDMATSGDLEKAYTMNAFADHFLEDCFSSGHLRTPRRSMHDPTFSPDLCAKASYMHDEDCAIGLAVRNRRGESWTCFGDRNALDTANSANVERCVAAVQASADEIYEAFTNPGAVTSPRAYKAWTIAPTLKSALGNQELAPLFCYEDATHGFLERRTTITDRRAHALTNDWSYATTAQDCRASGWWARPIAIAGPPKVAPRSSIAVMMSGPARLYFQNPAGSVLANVYVAEEQRWVYDGQSPLWNAIPATPLAAISWDGGVHIRVYYLDAGCTLHEACCDDGAWRHHSLGFQVARNSALAACRFERSGNAHIRVYYQEEDSHDIVQVCYYPPVGWDVRPGSLRLSSALSGTSLAAVAYEQNGLQIRVYYQATDLSLCEHAYHDERWFTGEFKGGKAPYRTAIGALYGYRRGNATLDVYWVDAGLEIVRSIHGIGGCGWPPSEKVAGPLMPGGKFAPAQWGGGKTIQVYYQCVSGAVRSACCDDDGAWFV
ncbi:fungal fucose-specific lectin-domain-containing protein [Lenzites betulinus]|nr:fungal fucose-specific lectin-domain-containing protein [Lenzites betulinus]